MIPSMQPHPKIIAVASGKGGVGKTWCAINMSQALAMKGRKVLLFDGDLGLANVDIQLGLMPQKDISQVLGSDKHLSDVVTRYEDGGFDIIAGRSGSANFANLPTARLLFLQEQLTTLADSYDHIILDLGAGVDKMVRHLSAIASTNIVVITAEPTSLTDAYAYIKLMQSENMPLPHIIVNAADNKDEGMRSFNTLTKVCQNFLKISPTLLGIIRRDKHVPQSIRTQKPIIAVNRHAPAALDIQEIAKSL